MKALTVLQPWAQLLMLGAKRYEFRSWKTRHRGSLLIHAGRGFSETAWQFCATDPCRGFLARVGINSFYDLPRGVLLGTITVEDCLPTDQVLFHGPDRRDLALEEFPPGHWAWQMSGPRWLAVPIPCQGRLGVFDVPDRLLFPPVEKGDRTIDLGLNSSFRV